jgi:hypothetical protein
MISDFSSGSSLSRYSSVKYWSARLKKKYAKTNTTVAGSASIESSRLLVSPAFSIIAA